MPPIDWSGMWSLTVSPWELMLRGSVMYWFIFLAFRVFVRRDMGSIAIFGCAVLMLVATRRKTAWPVSTAR